jgi:RNA polymerase sigma-70 factor (ECF subfamily)
MARANTREVSPSEEDLVTERVSAWAAGPDLAAALAALKGGDRDVLLLAALGGLGNTEIAQALAIPYGTVCSRLARARRRVRAALGGDNPAGDRAE